jgi:hypothetical protein
MCQFCVKCIVPEPFIIAACMFVVLSGPEDGPISFLSDECGFLFPQALFASHNQLILSAHFRKIILILSLTQHSSLTVPLGAMACYTVPWWQMSMKYGALLELKWAKGNQSAWRRRNPVPLSTAQIPHGLPVHPFPRGFSFKILLLSRPSEQRAHPTILLHEVTLLVMIVCAVYRRTSADLNA